MASPLHADGIVPTLEMGRQRVGSADSAASAMSASSSTPAHGTERAALEARRAALVAELAEVDEALGRCGGGKHVATEEGSLEEYFATPARVLLRERLPWLVGLLLLQSCAAIVMDSFESLLDRHLVIAFFVPMIVGTGGNAGNQPGVMTTRALARGGVTRRKVERLLAREAGLALLTGGLLAVIAFLRVLGQYPDEGREALAIALAVFGMVNVAIFIGVGFSVGIDACNGDPANGAAPLLTTVADLLGITLLCGISALTLNSSGPVS